jgi:DNA modification methylase
MSDRFEPGYRQLIVATKARDRFWDGDAVRVPVKPHSPFTRTGQTAPNGRQSTMPPYDPEKSAGAPLLDWWLVSDEYEIEPREESNVTARYIVGDALEVLATLEPGSVDLVMSSPPFLALRSYLPADHEHKKLEIGSESTPGAFLDVMLDVVEACARVLAPHGSLVFELGDTYAGERSGGHHLYEGSNPEAGFNGSAGFGSLPMPKRGKVGWPLDKSKALIPQLFAVALAYGFNPLTGRTTEPWRVRNTVAWCRPNPPVGRDGDKFRPATSFLTVAAKARDRYWDGDAVRVPYSANTHAKIGSRESNGRGDTYGDPDVVRSSWSNKGEFVREDRGGAPLLDWWEIPTAPYKGAHYATYPPALVVPLVKSMCPQKVCRVCGQPSRRITENVSGFSGANTWSRHGTAAEVHTNVRGVENGGRPEIAQRETLGWSDCGCGCPTCGGSGWVDRTAKSPDGWSTGDGCEPCPTHADQWRPGVVLDPFAGSGTTLAVATGHGLEAIGIDLDSRNAELAYERIGMFLTVEHPEQAA